MEFKSGSADVGVISIDDRRRIKDLEAKVADLETKLSEARGLLKPQLAVKRSECHHLGTFTVADELLEVRCDQCDALIDPYEVLRKIAHREVNFCYTLNSLRKEAEDLAAQIARLKSARSRNRRAARKDDDVPATGDGGICAILRKHKLYALQIAMMPGGGAGMALAQTSLVRGKAIRSDGADVEAALADLLRELDQRAATASEG